MPRSSFRRSPIRRSPDKLWLILAGVNLTLAGILAIFLIKPHPASPGYGMMAKALENMENTCDFPLIIFEKAGSFTLSFEGEVKNGNVIGKIHDYNLEVFLQDDRLFVRKEGELDWEQSNLVELEGLTGFLKHPRTILQLINPSINSAKTGPDITYGGKTYKTVYWTLDTPDFWLSLFPEIDTSLISEGTLTADIAADNFSIHRIRINLKMELPDGETREITRTLSIKV